LQPRLPFKQQEIPSHKKVNDSLRETLIAWLTDPQFYEIAPDIAQRLEKLFNLIPPHLDRENNDSLTEKHIVVFPDRMDPFFKYYHWPVVLSADRIHSLQLMSIEGGNEAKNMFGHSELRIVLCDPKREQMSDECLTEDFAYHLVLTFRAQMPAGERLNPGKAIVGDYPSRAFLNLLSDGLAQYDKEKRVVFTLPLNLSRQQLELFVTHLSRVLKQEGPYKFFSNNCATELFAFLQALVEEPRFFESMPLSPNGLIQSAKNAGLINIEWPHQRKKTLDLLRLEDRGLAFVPTQTKQHYYFKELKKRISLVAVDPSMESRVFFSLRSYERLAWYDGIFRSIPKRFKTDKNKEKIKIIVGLITILEELLNNKLKHQLVKEVSLWLKSVDKDDLMQDSQEKFMASEQEILNKTTKKLKHIKKRGHLITLTTHSELQKWRRRELRARKEMTENWLLKRQLSLLLANTELDGQQQITNYLQGLNNPQNPPPQPTDHQPNDNIDEAHYEAYAPPLVELDITRSE
jgi:hypothetical protein